MKTSKRRFEIRKQRIRSRISKISDRPRLLIYKSNKHIFAQVIDLNGNVMASASTLEKNIYIQKKNMCNKILAAKIGGLISSRASEAGVKEIVFDRGGYKYHGVVAVFADAARENLSF